ncbi:hypothetical protein C8J56DRAFT_896488 [Mycena floridula]|nr:hypothetical protein C8J56DRAFT_896488 [Mycena floridula]
MSVLPLVFINIGNISTLTAHPASSSIIDSFASGNLVAPVSIPWRRRSITVFPNTSGVREEKGPTQRFQDDWRLHDKGAKLRFLPAKLQSKLSLVFSQEFE